jgi:hypothetical protein
MLVFSDVVFLGLVAYFLVSKPRSDLHSLVRFIDVHFTWIAAAMGAFIAVALFFAVVKSKQPVEELVLLAKQLGWTLERRWGFHGGFGALSLFGCGPYFRVFHRGLTLAFCPIVDEDSRELGLRVTAFHNRPLGLGLMLKTGVGLFMGRMDDEYRGILTKRLEIPVENVQVWAANAEKARDLLSDAPILNCLDSLKQELDSLNEEAESRLISRSSGVVICDLSLALSCAEVVPALPPSKTGDRIYRSVLVTLIALVIASLIWVLTDYIRGIL